MVREREPSKYMGAGAEGISTGFSHVFSFCHKHFSFLGPWHDNYLLCAQEAQQENVKVCRGHGQLNACPRNNSCVIAS